MQLNLKKTSEEKLRKRQRICLSFSLRDFTESKVAFIDSNKLELKINNKIKLSRGKLWKYLILKGLNELDTEYGEITLISNKMKEIFK